MPLKEVLDPRLLRTRRPPETFVFPSDYQPDEFSWFERNKYSVLQSLLIGSDDVRTNRTEGMRLLAEAWRPDFQRKNPGATATDRVHHIFWLQQWLTMMGFATRRELALMRYASMHNAQRVLLDHYDNLANIQLSEAAIREDDKPLPQRWPPGELRIALLGAFAPPTPNHLALFAFYRLFCHMFIIGMDSDALLAKRKPYVVETYPYKRRRSILAGFPHLFEHVRSLPPDFMRGNDYDDAYISGFIRSNHINLVALNPHEPGGERRRAQIRAAGATPFDLEVGSDTSLHSSHIRVLKAEGLLGFKSLT